MALLAGWLAQLGDQRPDAVAAVDDVGLLAAEERDVLPLAAAHLTIAEWQELGRDGVSAIPKSQTALAFGTMMHDGDPEVIALILSQAGMHRTEPTRRDQSRGPAADRRPVGANRSPADRPPTGAGARRAGTGR